MVDKNGIELTDEEVSNLWLLARFGDLPEGMIDFERERAMLTHLLGSIRRDERNKIEEEEHGTNV